jgi:uncharacterized protein YgiM (DUF1202 family)
MKYLFKPFIPNVLILILALFFLFGCSGTKPATKPNVSVQPTTEQPEEETTSSKPPLKPATVSPAKPSPPPPSPTPKATPETPLRVTKVVWTAVNLREGPGTSYKVIGNVKKGTSLAILAVKGNWLHVRLEDKSEAWVSKAATSEASKPPPASPTTPSKPTPL